MPTSFRKTAKDTQWLVVMLSGGAAPVPGLEEDEACADAPANENDVIALLVHKETPMKPVIKTYVINQVPGLQGTEKHSKKGKATQVGNFTKALEASRMKLFHRVNETDWEKLCVVVDRMGELIEQHARRVQERRATTEGAFLDVLKILEDDPVGAPKVEVTIREVVNIKALKARFASGVDSVEALMQVEAYIKRLDAEAVPWADAPVDMVDRGAYVELKVTYANSDRYGRLMAKGPSIQKLSSGAREAALRNLCMSVDAACCHIRLVLRRLCSMALFDEDRFGFIALAGKHCKQWRYFLASHSGVPLEEGKLMLTKLSYGAKPRTDIPFIRKFAHQMQDAAEAILQSPECAWALEHYGGRRNPTFSRFAYSPFLGDLSNNERWISCC